MDIKKVAVAAVASFAVLMGAAVPADAATRHTKLAAVTTVGRCVYGETTTGCVEASRDVYAWTANDATVTRICHGHRFSTHYFRVSFCTGRRYPATVGKANYLASMTGVLERAGWVMGWPVQNLSAQDFRNLVGAPS